MHESSKIDNILCMHCSTLQNARTDYRLSSFFMCCVWENERHGCIFDDVIV